MIHNTHKHYKLYPKVKEIDSPNGRPRSPAECLMEVLNLWLSQAYDATKHGEPTWEALCRAVSSSVGGNNPAGPRSEDC